MNSLEISQALRRDPVVRNLFVGVFAADTLGDKEFPGLYIANTHPSDKPGEHWVAFFTPTHGLLEAFDSFGNNPCIYSDYLRKWMDGDFLVMSGVQRQSFDATTCGQYCMFYVLLRAYGFSYLDIQSALVKNRSINDKFVTKFVNKYFNLTTTVQDRNFLLSSLRGKK